MDRLRLALTAAEAKARPSSELRLAAVQMIDFEAGLSRLESLESEVFRPHTSLVEQGPVAVNARELLKRARSDIHGSVSLGIDSNGGWGTHLELRRQLSPDLLLEVGIGVGQDDSWEASMSLHKQLRPSIHLEVAVSVQRGNDWDHDWN